MRGAGWNIGALKDMVKKLKADLACQIVFGFRVAVKGLAPDISCIDNILDAYFFIACFGKQLDKGINDYLPGFCLLSMVCSAPFPIMYIL